MNGRTGGITNNNRDHEQNVGFHPQNAKELAEYLLPHYEHIQSPVEILDACSGRDGVLGKAFNDALIGHGERRLRLLDSEFTGEDVLGHAERKYDIILCNPPWALKKSLPIYNHLLTLLSSRGVLIFVVNLVYCYQGSDRAEVLQYQKHYFLPRWTFKPSGRPLLDCGVMVYHADGNVPKIAAELRPYIPLKRVDTRLEAV